MQQGIDGAEEPRARGLGQAQRAEVIGLLVGGQLGDLRLHLGGERNRFRAQRRGRFPKGARHLRRRFRFRHVDDHEKRPAGEKSEMGEGLFLRVAHRQGPQRGAPFQVPGHPLELLRLASGVSLLPQALEALLRHLQVGEDQLGVVVAQIAERIGIPLESPDHEAEGVDLAQRLQGFRLERHSLAPRSGQVGEQHLGGRRLAWLEHRAEPVETRIRDLDGAEV